jgi:hypothetical protein
VEICYDSSNALTSRVQYGCLCDVLYLELLLQKFLCDYQLRSLRTTLCTQVSRPSQGHIFHGLKIYPWSIQLRYWKQSEPVLKHLYLENFATQMTISNTRDRNFSTLFLFLTFQDIISNAEYTSHNTALPYLQDLFKQIRLPPDHPDRSSSSDYPLEH